MAGLLDMFDPSLYGGQMAGLLANLPGYQAMPGQPQGFPGMPTDMSGQSRASGQPMQIAPEMPGQPMGAPAAPAAPQMGLLDRIGAGLGANSNTMLAMGASLLGGQGFGGAAQAAMGGRALDQKQASANMTEAALVKQGLTPDLAKVVAGNPALMSAVMQHRMGIGTGNQTDDIKEYQFAKQEDPSLTFDKFMARKRSVTGEHGLNLVYGTNDKGETIALQPSKSGGLTEAKLPPNIKLSSGVEFKDLGTEIGIFDRRTGAFLGTKPKDVRGAAKQREEGEAQGKSTAALPAAIASAEQTLTLIDEMVKHPGRETATGLSSWLDPRNYLAGTDATNFRVRSDQMQGRTFLTAFEQLKGAGAITEQEGKAATSAIARLNTAQGDEEYLAALNELKAIVVKGMEIARQKAGGAQPGAAGAPPPSGAKPDPLGLR
jgi:hypothetical protein